ncbi:MAG: hypothetical protein ISR69_04545 [Gammaproteobacteria bacterium]|nr:hypothetical protein [Gammaproteobacteria bacterium]
MSEQSLRSKTITKRNVAQSTVIFSVVVVTLTVSALAAMAYLDFTESNDSASAEKTIPQMIAEQKIKAAKIREAAELKAQSSELVVALDKRVEGLKQLEKKFKKVEQQMETLKFVTNTSPAVQNAQVQQFQSTYPLQNNQHIYLDDVYGRRTVYQLNSAVNYKTKQQSNAQGEASYSIKVTFKARGQMNGKQSHNYNHVNRAQHFINSQFKTQNSKWNTKSI